MLLCLGKRLRRFFGREQNENCHRPVRHRRPGAGREFYEKQGEGLGAYFEDSLAADIDSLSLFAGIHSVVLGYHRMLSAKFPYAVYYEIVGEQVRIRAVLDCRRDPK